MREHQARPDREQSREREEVDGHTQHADGREARCSSERYRAAGQNHQAPSKCRHLKEIHLRFAAPAIWERDRHLCYAQRIPSNRHDLKADLKSARAWVHGQKTGSANCEEPGHWVMNVCQRPSEDAGDPGQHPSPRRPIWRRSTGHITTADDHVACSGQYRRHEFGDEFRRVAKIRVHDDDDR